MAGYTPVRAGSITPFIMRGYNESEAYQWVREVIKNAYEANATRVFIGVDWHGVEATGVYRMMVADDGEGMGADELRSYFMTFGGGGKPIGDLDENYGVGSKTALWPWNRRGVVIVSWQDGVASMIRIAEQDNGEFGLVHEEDEDGNALDVYEPYFDEDLGIDWAEIRSRDAKFIKDHGTVIVLLGNDPDFKEDTILGDPRDWEGDQGPKSLSVTNYLNRRFYDFESDRQDENGDVIPFTAVAMDWPTDPALKWPTETVTSYTAAAQRNDKGIAQIRTRVVQGLTNWVNGTKPKDVQSGVVDLGTAKATWFLQPEDVKPQSGGYTPTPKGGGVCVRLDGEVFYLTNGATFRKFGLTEPEVLHRTWIVIDAQQFTDEAYAKDKHHYGLFMQGNRTTLNWGGDYASHGLVKNEMPWNEWSDRFYANPPEAIVEALKAARSKGGDESKGADRIYKRIKERLAARTNSVRRFLRDPNGTHQVTLTMPGRGRKPPVKPPVKPVKAKAKPPVKPGKKALGSNQGTAPTGTDTASEARPVRLGIPEFQWKNQAWFDDREAPYAIACWDRKGGVERRDGLVTLNADHPVVQESIAHWQTDMARQDEQTLEETKDVVREVFAEMAIATVTNAEVLRAMGQTATDLDDTFRSPQALTTALIGVFGTDALIGPRLGAVGRRAAA